MTSSYKFTCKNGHTWIEEDPFTEDGEGSGSDGCGPYCPECDERYETEIEVTNQPKEQHGRDDSDV